MCDERLNLSDPAWLRRVALGARCLYVCAIAELVMAVMVGFGVVLFGGEQPLGQFQQFCYPVLGLAILTSFLFLTSAEPGGHENSIGLRFFVRAISIVVCGLTLYSTSRVLTVTMPQSDQLALGVAYLLAALAQRGTGLLYASRIAWRIPDPDLSHYLQLTIWGWAVTMGFVCVSSVHLLVTGTHLPDNRLMNWLGCVVGPVGLGLGLWSIVLLGRLGHELSRISRDNTRKEEANAMSNTEGN